MRAATKVWLATAQLQRERGPHADFSKEEIARRVEVAGWTNGPGTETVRVHISSHCVASARPNPARDRMLTRTRWGHYRLYRPGDPTHPGRATGRVHPAVEDVPPPFLSLLTGTKTSTSRPSPRGRPRNQKRQTATPNRSCLNISSVSLRECPATTPC